MKSVSTSPEVRFLFIYTFYSMCMCAVVESPGAESCHPECSREYCQAHPLETCSARSVKATFQLRFMTDSSFIQACHSSVSLEEAPCQGSCQHTSCSSCLLLNPPPCPQTCTHSDSACLHRYGRCVHTHLAGLLNPVCHNDLQVRYYYYYY